MPRGLEGKSVKSARRVLEVLEYFGTGPAEVTVMEMSRALDYPQSSTSELLSSLVMLGYLSHDRRRRTFRPTVRVAAIGTSIEMGVFRHGAMSDLVDELHAETGTIVVVGMEQRGVLHHVKLAGSSRPMREFAPGPLLHSALGQALLSAMPDGEVRMLVHRLNAEAEPGRAVSTSAFLALMADVRQRGYALAPAPELGGTMLAAVVPHPQPDRLAIGILLPEGLDATDHRDIFDILRRKFGRLLASSAMNRQEPRHLAAVA